MGDKLERFIIENRGSFDDVIPSGKIWEGVDKNRAGKQRFFQIAWRSAAVVFLASTLYLIVDRNIQAAGDAPRFSEEFHQAESYYIQLISQKKTETEHLLTREQHEEFLPEINELDAMYTKLKDNYGSNSSNDRIVDAMIHNLQLRLNILESQLEILGEIKHNKDESDENTQI